MALEPCSLLFCAGLGVFSTWAQARTGQLDQEPEHLDLQSLSGRQHKPAHALTVRVVSPVGGKTNKPGKRKEQEQAKNKQQWIKKLMVFAFCSSSSRISSGATFLWSQCTLGSAGQCFPCTNSSLLSSRLSLIFKYANTSEEPFKLLTTNRSEGPLSS